MEKIAGLRIVLRKSLVLILVLLMFGGNVPSKVLAYDWRPNRPGGSTGNTSVNHIDIAIDLTATVYINGKEEKINFSLTTGDAQYVTITASPTSTEFSLSGGVSTSTDNSGNAQIRIEGDFPVGTSSAPVYYTVTLSKTLYSSNNTPVQVTLSTTMHYWDSGNVCPGFQTSPGSMSGIDLNLADTAKGNLLIQKTIAGAALTEDKSYNFHVLDTSGNVYAMTTVTVPAGQTTASVILANLNLGTYTVVEQADNVGLSGYESQGTTYTNNGTISLSAANNFVSCNVTTTYKEAHIHKYNSTIIEPTCTENGYTVHECVCGETYTDAENPTRGHLYKDNLTLPSCTKPGFTTHTCTVCGDAYIDNKTPANGHAYKGVVTKPTCLKPGYTTHTCSVCGDTYVNAETLASGHNYEGKVTEPACTKTGFTTFTCTNCGDSYTDDETPERGHDYQFEVTPPTCSESGYTTYTCTACGNSYIDAESPAKGHSYKAEVTLPSCTADGYTIYTCSDCEHTYVNSEILAKGHDYKSKITSPSCAEDGYTTHTCSVCGDTYVNAKTPATGHSYESVVTAAACTKEGFTTHTCKICNDTYIDTQTEATGHYYISTVIPPQIDVQGYTEHECTWCGDKYIDDYTALLPEEPQPGEQPNESEYGSAEISIIVPNGELIRETAFLFNFYNEQGEIAAKDIAVMVPAGSNTGTIEITLRAGLYTVIRSEFASDTFLSGEVATMTIEIIAGEQTKAEFTAELIALSITVTAETRQNVLLSGVEALLEWSGDGETWHIVEAARTSALHPGYCQAESFSQGRLTSGENGVICFTGLYPGVNYRVTIIGVPDGFSSVSSNIYCDTLRSSVVAVSTLAEIQEDDPQDNPTSDPPMDKGPPVDTDTPVEEDAPQNEDIPAAEEPPMDKDAPSKTGDERGKAIMFCMCCMATSAAAVVFLLTNRKQFA